MRYATKMVPLRLPIAEPISGPLPPGVWAQAEEDGNLWVYHEDVADATVRKPVDTKRESCKP